MKDRKKSIIAIIPARGGSKGILRKNLRELGGRPLIVHTIEGAVATPSITRVIVSTDDEEIGTISARTGAEVIWRPKEISGDLASSESALLHVLDYLRNNESYEPDLVVFLQCTSPLTLPKDIDGTVHALIEEDADSALSVSPFHYFLWRRDEFGNATGINHDSLIRPLRQDREEQFLETGAVYVMKAKGFVKEKHRFFGKIAMHIVPKERCLEIDEPFDLRIAEIIMNERRQQERVNALPERIGAVNFDFDGVFTDNRVIVFEDGTEAVVCSRGDGWGLERLKELGIPILVLSTERNPVVRKRCEKLSIPFIQGVVDKRKVLGEWLRENGIDGSSAVYLGNDENDVECLQMVGCGVAVGDSHARAKEVSRIVLESRGGLGAVRELCDLILRKIVH